MGKCVFVANDNAPKQVVVSARTEDLAAFVSGMDAVKPGLCKMLRVSGPWHTPMLEEARGRFQEWLGGVPFAVPTLPLISNATAALERDPVACRLSIARQLTQRVRWRETMDGLRERGVSIFLEVGPQRVLAGLARLNGFGEETVVRGVDSLRSVEQVSQDQLMGGGK
jgi:[acyl-carrier-protein] S-malonyltransferase